MKSLLVLSVAAANAAPVYPESTASQPHTEYQSQLAAPPPERFGLGANYYALTYHPGGGGAVYPRQFDDKAYWVLQVGAEA